MKIKKDETVFARINNGIYSQLFSILMMICMIVFKVSYYCSLQNAPASKSNGKTPQEAKLMIHPITKIRLQQFGFVTQKGSQTCFWGDCEEDIDLVKSFMFEIVCIPILVVGTSMLWM